MLALFSFVFTLLRFLTAAAGAFCLLMLFKIVFEFEDGGAPAASLVAGGVGFETRAEYAFRFLCIVGEEVRAELTEVVEVGGILIVGEVGEGTVLCRRREKRLELFEL